MHDPKPDVGHVHGPTCDHDHDHGHHHPAADPARNPTRDVGRNDFCPCNSRKKFKKCHGA
ncbi:MAG: zinc chelation protein SecC [Gammaproteobacteria bacterium]|nr:zinc chelation protein SecC [Gammaproteobacteria bacterium]